MGGLMRTLLVVLRDEGGIEELRNGRDIGSHVDDNARISNGESSSGRVGGGEFD